MGKYSYIQEYKGLVEENLYNKMSTSACSCCGLLPPNRFKPSRNILDKKGWTETEKERYCPQCSRNKKIDRIISSI